MSAEHAAGPEPLDAMSPEEDTSPQPPQVGGANEQTSDAQQPFLRVERGRPSVSELAAITVTLAAVVSSSGTSSSSGSPQGAESDRAGRRSVVRWGSTSRALQPVWVRRWVGW
ncbi:MAG: acyl-CoA carboxylase epsilon subunit [Micrococcales bacterium]|nr:acyl-CoA carboxylase epsilon subunit [Micrococcales bacterium]